MYESLRRHWPEYLMEAALLGLFMISAGTFTILLEHPASPIHVALASPLLRRALAGLAMGLTAIALIYSPWGRQSGAHFNPAVTLTFYRLKRIAAWDAVFYIAAQFVGGTLAVALFASCTGDLLRTVHYATTLPGRMGPSAAFAAEFCISAVLMSVVLSANNHPQLRKHTGLLCGTLVALFITFESPYSGMSMNPARSFSSAVPAGIWSHLWIYFVAPILGMLAAAELRGVLFGPKDRACAKLHHASDKRCIFCGHRMAAASIVLILLFTCTGQGAPVSLAPILGLSAFELQRSVPCLSLRTVDAEIACLRNSVPATTKSRFDPKGFGDEWDRVARAIRRLKCPPIEVRRIIDATNEFGRAAALARGSYTVSVERVISLDASADNLIRVVQLLTVNDKARANALRAIKRFRRKIA